MSQQITEIIYYGETYELDGGGSGGSSDYEDLDNLPQINGVTLIGNKTYSQLKLVRSDGSAVIQGGLTLRRSDGEAGSNLPTYLIAGNNTPKKEAGSTYGRIRLWGQSGDEDETVYRADIYPPILTANRNFALPNKGGTLALTSDIPVKAVSVTTKTIRASGWSNGVYSFESTYPKATYNIGIEPNGDSITSAQYDAWCAAKIVGMQSANSIKALGTVPTVNIPVILHLEKIA